MAAGVDVPLARRWFWVLLVVAVLSTGALFWAINAPSGPLPAAVLFVSGLTAVASIVQATRIMRVLNGPVDLSLQPRGEDTRSTGGRRK